jgi:hypothetical protein
MTKFVECLVYMNSDFKADGLEGGHAASGAEKIS